MGFSRPEYWAAIVSLDTRSHSKKSVTCRVIQIDDVIESYGAAVLAAEAEPSMRLCDPGVRVFDAKAILERE